MSVPAGHVQSCIARPVLFGLDEVLVCIKEGHLSKQIDLANQL